MHPLEQRRFNKCLESGLDRTFPEFVLPKLISILHNCAILLMSVCA